MADDVGDLPIARAFVEEALEVARQLGDEVAILASSIELVRRLFDEGDWTAGERLLDESLVVAWAQQDARALAILRTFKGQLFLLSGAPRAAADEFGAALALAQEVGDIQVAQMIMAKVARAQFAAGDPSAGRAHLRRSMQLATELRYDWGLAWCLSSAAELALAEDDVVDAANLLVRAERIFDDIGGRPSGLDGALYRNTWRDVRRRIDSAALSDLRDALPPADVEEALDYLSHYLD